MDVVELRTCWSSAECAGVWGFTYEQPTSRSAVTSVTDKEP